MKDLTTPQWNEGDTVKNLPVYKYLIRGELKFSTSAQGPSVIYCCVYYTTNPNLTLNDLINEILYVDGSDAQGRTPFSVVIQGTGSGGNTIYGVYKYFSVNSEKIVIEGTTNFSPFEIKPTITLLGGGQSKRHSQKARCTKKLSKKEGCVNV